MVVLVTGAAFLVIVNHTLVQVTDVLNLTGGRVVVVVRLFVC